MTVPHTDHADASDRIAAIRYTVLRKLVPGIRHALMGHLQAVQWATEAAARGLHTGSDPGKARENIHAALRESVAAIKSSDSMLQWLRPTAERSIDAGDGIAACIKVAGEDWFLRGIEVRVDRMDQEFYVSQRCLQEMVVAALLALADVRQQNVDIRVRVRAIGDALEVAVTADAAERQSAFSMPTEGRPLTWADVALLAEANGVECTSDADGARLRFNRFVQA